jgi:PKD repeat protein
MRRSSLQSIVGVAGLAATALAVAGCGRGGQGEAVEVRRGALGAATQRITVALPEGAGFDAVSVAAADELRISDRARVQLASGIAAGAIANSGTTLTDVGVESKVGTTTSAAPVTLRDRAEVTGNVVSAQSITRMNDTVVTGSVSPNTPLTFDRWSWLVSLPASGAPVSVPVNSSRSIAPGAYAGVQAFAGATLSLVAGTYYMDSLTMEPQSRLAVDTRNGNVIIYLRLGFTFRGSTVFTGPNDRLLIAYLGTASPALDRSFNGNFVAPNASVRLGVGGSPYAGAVYAKAVVIDPDVRFTARRFAGWGQMPFSVEPRFNCVERRPGGAFVGHFGYRNPGSAPVNIAVGTNNRFSPGLENRQQPTTFLPGVHDSQFAVIWVNHQASWFLNSVEARVDAAKVCPIDTAFAGNADTTVKSASDRANFGAATTLEVGAGQHTLVSFDRAAIASFLGPNRLIRAARLEVTLSGAAPTTPVEVIAMRTGWTEPGATWNCANDTDTSTSGESCVRPDRWKMVRRDTVWQNPWYRVVPGASNVGTVQGGKLVFDVTGEAQRFLGAERTTNEVSFILQAVGATGLSGTLKSREAGPATAPKLVIEPIAFTDYDVVTADDQHAPFSISVDATVVPSRAPLPPIVAGGAARPVAAVRGPDGRLVEFADSEIMVFTDSASELAAVQTRLGATVLYTSPFTAPDMPRVSLLRINPALANPAALVPGLRAKVPGLRGRQRASSDSAVRLLAAAFDEAGRGSKVAINLLMEPTGLDVRSLSREIMVDGRADALPNPEWCPTDVSGFCNNAFDWRHFKPDMHNVTNAWKAFRYTALSLVDIDVAIMDTGFRPDKLDGLGTATISGCLGPGPCPNAAGCGSDSGCLWHGTNVANAGFAEPDNLSGAAGPGWPAIRNTLSLIHTNVSYFDYVVGSLESLFTGTDILNMSFSDRIADYVYAALAVTRVGLWLEWWSERLRLAGTLQFASAGNDGDDVDKLRCFDIKEPISDSIAGVFGGETPLQGRVCPWEEWFYWPCEAWGVDCVEGSNLANRSLDPRSNHGPQGGTQYRASFSARVTAIDTADDTRHTLRTGTSFATPVVSGIAALTWTLNPTLSSWDVEDCLRSGGGGKFVDAFESVSCALGSPSNFSPFVQITSPEDQKEIPRPGIGIPTEARLTAWADDIEDTTINVINWFVNGTALGTTQSGQDLIFTIPGPGNYTATATVQDSGGLGDSSTITFYVTADLPDVVIVTPPKLGNVTGTRFPAYVDVPIDLFAKVNNRPLARCEDVKWTARQGTVLMFADKPGCFLKEAFFTPQPPGLVELTATYADALGSDSDTVIVDLLDDGGARIEITSPKIGGFDGKINVVVGQPTPLIADPRRIPIGNPFTWTYQAAGQPLQQVGLPIAATTVTFSVPVPNCSSVPGTIHVTAFDTFGLPIHDDIDVSFTGDCIVQ